MMNLIIIDTLKSGLSDSFISHTTQSEWGGSFLVMEKNGHAFARTYWFHEESDNIFFDWLDVSENARNEGFGNELLDHHIDTANKLNLNSFLWAVKDSWIHDWYIRKGYLDKGDHSEMEGCVWMMRSPD